jgi:hypothetical protein
VGTLALPGATPARPRADGAAWLWIALVLLGLLTVTVLAVALVWIQNLP